MSNESEFGEILCRAHHGNVIKTETGEIIYMSEAFNSLNVTKLSEILDVMRILGAEE